MSHLPTCRPCDEAPECVNPNTRYSLQDEVFTFVGNPNGGRDRLYLACCDGVLMLRTFPLGATPDERAQIIQDLLGDCARREPFCQPPPPPCLNPPCEPTVPPLFNRPQSCTVNCPDGTPFTYTVPAGVFVGSDQELLDRLARELACREAERMIICISPWGGCVCADVAIQAVIPITSINPPFTVGVISGALPPGVRVVTRGNQIVITGTPTASGSYGFGLRVVDRLGNSNSKTYTIAVLEITTTSLPNWTAGSPYSFQLTASGGSGSYAWVITSGTLPEGLTMTVGGLISGTPIGAGTPVNLTFSVIDLACESTSRSFYPPRISLNTSATTILRSRRGYPEYTYPHSGSGNLYKKITYTGEISQLAYVTGLGLDPETFDPVRYVDAPCGGARYVYNGSTEINLQGAFIDHHHKNLYVQCLRPIYPQIGGEIAELQGAPVSRLLGYCWILDSQSCWIGCIENPEAWPFDSDKNTNGLLDMPQQMVTDLGNVTVISPVQFQYTGNATATFDTIAGVGLFPGVFPTTSAINVPMNTLIRLNSTGTFGATLSDVYTEADAISVQQTYHTSQRTAENLPNYLRGTILPLHIIYSRFTTVEYRFNCTNLLIGENYAVRFQLVDSDGTVTNMETDFTADGSTQVVTGTIPDPAAGHRKFIRNVQISFAI